MTISTLYRATFRLTRSRGFTLLDLVAAVGIAAVLSAIAIPTYQAYIQKARVAHAVADIMTIATAIGRYNTVNNALPPDLVAVGMDTLQDPWGYPYVYQSFVGLNGKGKPVVL